MAQVIQDQIKVMQDMLKNVEHITIAELEKNPNALAEMNREQLMSGINADGGSMPNYAASSKKSGKINLLDKGPFQAGIKPMFDDQGMDMISTDSKTSFLNPFRQVINTLGLTPDNIDQWITNAIPKIQDTLKKLLK